MLYDTLENWKRFAWWFVVSLWWWLGKTTVWVRGLTLDRLRFALWRLTKQKDKQTKIKIEPSPLNSPSVCDTREHYWMLIKDTRTGAALTLAGCHCFISPVCKTSIHQGRRIDAESAIPYWWPGKITVHYYETKLEYFISKRSSTDGWTASISENQLARLPLIWSIHTSSSISGLWNLISPSTWERMFYTTRWVHQLSRRSNEQSS